jgi:hypothetical protein
LSSAFEKKRKGSERRKGGGKALLLLLAQNLITVSGRPGGLWALGKVVQKS